MKMILIFHLPIKTLDDLQWVTSRLVVPLLHFDIKATEAGKVNIRSKSPQQNTPDRPCLQRTNFSFFFWSWHMHAFFHSCCGRALHLHRHKATAFCTSKATEKCSRQCYRENKDTADYFANKLRNLASERRLHLGIALFSIKLQVITVVEISFSTPATCLMH